MIEEASDFLLDFGVDAVISAGTVKVILDNAAHFALGVENTVPTVVGAASDLSSVDKGDAVSIAGTNYTVSHPPLSDGVMTTLVLRRA